MNTLRVSLGLAAIEDERRETQLTLRLLLNTALNQWSHACRACLTGLVFLHMTESSAQHLFFSLLVLSITSLLPARLHLYCECSKCQTGEWIAKLLLFILVFYLSHYIALHECVTSYSYHHIMCDVHYTLHVTRNERRLERCTNWDFLPLTRHWHEAMLELNCWAGLVSRAARRRS